MRCFYLLFLFIFSFGLKGQESSGPKAKKPIIMVMPQDNWMEKNGFVTLVDNMGTKDKIYDYERALSENSEIGPVIAKINGLMGDRGFPLTSLSQMIKSVKTESAEDAATSSKSGNSISESLLDKLKKKAKCDIVFYVDWNVTNRGPQKTINFTMEGIDAYSNKSVASETGQGTPSFTADIPLLLEEAVLGRIENFNSRLQTHFDDMFKNGREVAVRIKVFENTGVDLEQEFNGKELTEIIDDWFAANTVSGRYSQTDATANMMQMDQVRIPLFTQEGKAMDTKQFVTQLKKYLNAPPYNIVCKVTTQGLGKATLILGEK